jgi:hypothetical protein
LGFKKGGGRGGLRFQVQIEEERVISGLKRENGFVKRDMGEVEAYMIDLPEREICQPV